jgi:Leucine-rich repeat (LRR) protein
MIVNDQIFWLWVKDDCLNEGFTKIKEYKNLKYLDLSFNGDFGNNLTSYHLVEVGLLFNLECLIITGNAELEDISPLGQLTSLNSLYLCSIECVSDLSVLSKLTSLLYLTIDSGGGRGIKDISPLSILKKLKKLVINNCHSLFDFNCLRDLINLNELHVSHISSLKSLQSIKNLTNLKRLEIMACNNLVDISPIGNLNQIEFLDISYCHSIIDLLPLSQMTSLKFIDIKSCSSVKDISPIAGLPVWLDIEKIDLSNCKSISSIAPLIKLRNLRHLDLTNCHGIENTVDIAQLSALERLDMYNNPIIDLSPICQMQSLRELRLGFCRQIEDFSPLASLNELKVLYLSSNKQLKRIDWIKQMVSLVKLDLSGCENLIKVIPLASLSKLEIIDLNYCPNIRDIIELSNCENILTIDCVNMVDACQATMTSAFKRDDSNYVGYNMGFFIQNLEFSKYAHSYTIRLLNCLSILESDKKIPLIIDIASAMRSRGLQSEALNDLDANTWDTWCNIALELEKDDALSSLFAAVNELDVVRESEVILGPVIVATSKMIEKYPEEKENFLNWVNEQLQLLEEYSEEQRQIAPSAAVFFASLNRKDDVLFWLQKATDEKAPLWRERVLKALVNHYAEHENFSEARRLLDEMEIQDEKDLAIASLAKAMASKYPVEAGFLLHDIHEAGVSAEAARNLLSQPAMLHEPQGIYQLLLHLQSNPDELAETLEKLIELDTEGKITDSVKQLFLQPQATGPSASVLLELCKHPAISDFVKPRALEKYKNQLQERANQELTLSIPQLIAEMQEAELLEEDEAFELKQIMQMK